MGHHLVVFFRKSTIFLAWTLHGRWSSRHHWVAQPIVPPFAEPISSRWTSPSWASLRARPGRTLMALGYMNCGGWNWGIFPNWQCYGEHLMINHGFVGVDHDFSHTHAAQPCSSTMLKWLVWTSQATNEGLIFHGEATRNRWIASKHGSSKGNKLFWINTKVGLRTNKIKYVSGHTHTHTYIYMCMLAPRYLCM